MADTDWMADETASLDRLPKYSGRDYDANDPVDQYAFGEGGYLVNQMRQANDVQVVGRGARRMALSASSAAILAVQEAANAKAERIASQSAATDAYNSAQEAAGQVALAAVQAQRLQATSTSSVTPSVASKTFTTQAGKALDIGSTVLVQSRSNIDRWMFGRVTNYANTSLTVAVEVVGTVVTTAADWNIGISGLRGVQGVQGIPGIPVMGYRFNSNAGTERPALKHAGYLMDFSYSGSISMVFDPVSSLGAGWYAVLRNVGAGDIVLDPNGSETIDGLTSFVMYPGEARLVQCDGTALRSAVLEGGTKTFTFSSTLTWPPGVNGAIVSLRSGQSGGAGGGGGGGGYRTNNAGGGFTLGGGGGGGGASGSVPIETSFVLDAQPPGTLISVDVGAGGNGGAGGAGGPGSQNINNSATSGSVGGAGQVGGNSQFGTFFRSIAGTVGGPNPGNGGAPGMGQAGAVSGGGGGGGGTLPSLTALVLGFFSKERVQGLGGTGGDSTPSSASYGSNGGYNLDSSASPGTPGAGGNGGAATSPPSNGQNGFAGTTGTGMGGGGGGGGAGSSTGAVTGANGGSGGAGGSGAPGYVKVRFF